MSTKIERCYVDSTYLIKIAFCYCQLNGIVTHHCFDAVFYRIEYWLNRRSSVMKKKSIPLLLCISFIAAMSYCFWVQWLPMWLLYVLIFINVLNFIFYGMDKLAAVKHWQRTPEKHFYLLALLGGWPSGILGQLVFNHKTSKLSFQRYFYGMMLLNISINMAYLYYYHV